MDRLIKQAITMVVAVGLAFIFYLENLSSFIELVICIVCVTMIVIFDKQIFKVLNLEK